MAPRVDEIPAGDRPGHWVLPHWEGAGLRAGITDATLDLAIRKRPAGEAAAAWSGLLDALPGIESITASPQVHGRDILTHGAATSRTDFAPEADGHLTQTPGQAIGVTVADCVPVYLRDEASGWIGVLHAGWRGVAAGIMEAALAHLAAAGTNVKNVVIHCGISICGNCYEVGPEVFLAVESRVVEQAAPLDLRGALAARARAAGAESVTVSGLCALEHPAFHSHRGGATTQRMAAYLGRPLA